MSKLGRQVNKLMTYFHFFLNGSILIRFTDNDFSVDSNFILSVTVVGIGL